MNTFHTLELSFVTFPYFTFAFLLLTLGVARHASGVARHTSGIIVFIPVALLNKSDALFHFFIVNVKLNLGPQLVSIGFLGVRKLFAVI